MNFESYIVEQTFRNDEYGKFAREYLSLLENQNSDDSSNELTSNDLFGLCKYLESLNKSISDSNNPLIEIWNEYVQNQDDGITVSNLERGYIYFLKLAGQNAFKIGKSLVDPIFLKEKIEDSPKGKLYIYNWIKIYNSSVIESELKQTFNKYLEEDEFYKFKNYGLSGDGNAICLEINDAISIYSRTDGECIVYSDM